MSNHEKLKERYVERLDELTEEYEELTLTEVIGVLEAFKFHLLQEHLTAEEEDESTEKEEWKKMDKGTYMQLDRIEAKLDWIINTLNTKVEKDEPMQDPEEIEEQIEKKTKRVKIGEKKD